MPKNNTLWVDTSIYYDDKVKELIKDKGIGAFGVLIMLWAFTALERPYGNITVTKVTRVINNITEDNELKKGFLAYLIDKNWIDKIDDNNVVIHKWSERQPHIIEYLDREKAKKEAKVRAGKASAEARWGNKVTESNTPITESNRAVTESNAVKTCVTESNTCYPNLTEPNLTKPIKDLKKEKDSKKEKNENDAIKILEDLKSRTKAGFFIIGKKGERNRTMVMSLLRTYKPDEILSVNEFESNRNMGTDKEKFLSPSYLYQDKKGSGYPFSAKLEQAQQGGRPVKKSESILHPGTYYVEPTGKKRERSAEDIALCKKLVASLG